MSRPVVNSLIVTHSGRILDLLNGIMHETEINDLTKEEDPPIRDPHKFKYVGKHGMWTNKLIKIGNFGVVKLEISPPGSGTVNTITLLENGYGDKAGKLKNTKDDPEGTKKWGKFNKVKRHSKYVFYIVRHGFAEHNETKEKRRGEAPSGKTGDPVKGKKKGNPIKIITGIPYRNTKKDTSLVKDDSRHSQYIENAINAINGDLGDGGLIQYLFVSDLLRTRQTLQYLLKRETDRGKYLLKGKTDSGKYLQISPNTKDIYVLPCAHEINFPKWKVFDVLFQLPENIVADKPKNPFKCDRKYRVNWDNYDNFYFRNSTGERDGYFTSSKSYDMCNGPTMIENAIKVINPDDVGSDDVGSDDGDSDDDGSVRSSLTDKSFDGKGGGTRYRNYTRKRDTRKRDTRKRDTRKRDTRKRDTRKRDTRRYKRKRDTSKLRKK
jgi:hypothetical protein